MSFFIFVLGTLILINLLNSTTTGELVEIRRLYVQNGEVIQNSVTAVEGLGEYDSITEDFCTEQKTLFGDTNSFESKGGLAAMGNSFDAGMVLVMRLVSPPLQI